MRSVLYAHDLEPITIIDLPPRAWEFLRQHRQWNVAVMQPVRVSWPPEPVSANTSIYIVTIGRY